MILLIFRNLSVSSPSLSLLTITPALETDPALFVPGKQSTTELNSISIRHLILRQAFTELPRLSLNLYSLYASILRVAGITGSYNQAMDQSYLFQVWVSVLSSSGCSEV